MYAQLATHMSSEQTATQLRSIRQKHARKVATLCGIIRKAARGLLAVERALDRAAIKAAGQDYAEKYIITFQEHGSNEAQIETNGFITAPDFQSVLQMATDTEAAARLVAEAKEPPKLK